MECNNCKTIMKKFLTTGWVSKYYYWCPKCGTLLETYDIIGDERPRWIYPSSLNIKETK